MFLLSDRDTFASVGTLRCTQKEIIALLLPPDVSSGHENPANAFSAVAIRPRARWVAYSAHPDSVAGFGGGGGREWEKEIGREGRGCEWMGRGQRRWRGERKGSEGKGGGKN